MQPSVGSATTTTPVASPTPPPVGSIPLPSPVSSVQTPKVPAPGAANLSSVHLDQAARAAIDKVHSDLLKQHAAALAAKTAEWDRAFQDKDRLLREERTKRKADGEKNQLLLLKQHQQKIFREEQVKLQQEETQGLQQAAVVLRKQLADKSAETNRVSTQLHDANATITQHEIYESARDERAKNERSRVSVE